MTGKNNQEIVWSVGDFVAVFNQTIEFAYPYVVITGELANFRVSKNRWVYFDLKDSDASLRCFGTVYALPGPLEDGMLIQISGMPRLHPQFGFSITFQTIQPVGEGAIKKASSLLEAKLRVEGLFDDARKRSLPYPPTKVGLIASSESAAYYDFTKILSERWGGLEIQLVDVQVQGESSPAQLVQALEFLNTEASVDVIVMTRGGGSPEDLAAFSHEAVVRAVAASRTPTLVAIGHEIDVSLAELAADRRASTPSNAAEMLVPDKQHELLQLLLVRKQMSAQLLLIHQSTTEALKSDRQYVVQQTLRIVQLANEAIKVKKLILGAMNPQSVLGRGYALVRSIDKKLITSSKLLADDQLITIQFADGTVKAKINEDRLE